MEAGQDAGGSDSKRTVISSPDPALHQVIKLQDILEVAPGVADSAWTGAVPLPEDCCFSLVFRPESAASSVFRYTAEKGGEGGEGR